MTEIWLGNYNHGHLERSRKVLDSARTDQLSVSSNQSVIASEERAKQSQVIKLKIEEVVD